MSRLEELIKEKCPNGVKYKKLYEITNWDKRFNGVSQDMQTLSFGFLQFFLLIL